MEPERYSDSNHSDSSILESLVASGPLRCCAAGVAEGGKGSEQAAMQGLGLRPRYPFIV